MSPFEAGAVVFAVAYLVLAVRQSLWCWPAAIVSVVLSFVVFAAARLYMEAALQVFYLAMAVYGWQQWRSGGRNHAGVSVHWWSPMQHVLAIGGIAIGTAIAGRLLVGTSAALPYVDSFTTVAAIIATWMVARKVIENWIYWFVIDSVSVWLYLQRGLFLYAGLFVVYLILIVVGFRAWLADAAAEAAGAQSRLPAPESSESSSESSPEKTSEGPVELSAELPANGR